MHKFILVLLGAFAASGLLYASGNVLTPFIIALVLAYIVSPVANYLNYKHHVPRWAIALLLVTCMVAVFILIWASLLPIIYDQIVNFINSVPKYQLYIKKQVLPLAKTHLEKIDHTFVKNIPQVLDNALSLILKEIVIITNKILNSWHTVVDILLSVVLIPIFTFYFIKDWKTIGANIKNTIPIRQRKFYSGLSIEVNNTLSSIIRSQINTCVVLAIYYTIALSIIRVDFSVFIGIMTGLLSFIPFVSVLGGFITAAISAYFKFQSIYSVIAVIIVFLIGSAIEHVLVAVLMGKRTGLHPLLMMLFVLLGGQFFGFKGVLLAMPVGAVMMVLIKFIINSQYAKAYKE